MERALGDNEVVRVRAEDAEEVKRQEAWDHFLAGAREMHAAVAGVPEDELETLIDEALDYVRHNPRMRVTLDAGILLRAYFSPLGPAYRLIYELDAREHGIAG